MFNNESHSDSESVTPMAFLKNRNVRIILFFLVLSGIIWILNGGCSSKNQPDTSNDLNDSEYSKDPNDRSLSPGESSNGIPGPADGFQDSIPLASQYRALVESYGVRVTRTESDLTTARTEIANLQVELDQALQTDRSNTLRFDRILQDLKESSFSNSPHPPPDGPTGAKSSLRPGGSYDTNTSTEVASNRPGLRLIRFIPEDKDALLQEQRSRLALEARKVHIPAGSTAMAVITNGVFAPTTGEPSPVRLFLETDLRGPNGSRIPLGEAFMIGKATGIANSMRVTIEIDRMSIVTPDGKAHDARVLAYVVGHDALEGVPGEYHWRAAELLPLAAGASGLTAAAGALAAAETITSVSPLGGATEFLTGSAPKYAGFQGIAGGSRKLEEMIVDRMKEIQPAISIKPYRRVNVVFLQSVTLDGITPVELESEKTNANPFTGLDLHK